MAVFFTRIMGTKIIISEAKTLDLHRFDVLLTLNYFSLYFRAFLLDLNKLKI